MATIQKVDEQMLVFYVEVQPDVVLLGSDRKTTMRKYGFLHFYLGFFRDTKIEQMASFQTIDE